MAFVKFTNIDGVEVHINPNRVQQVAFYERLGTVSILFGNKDGVVVREPVDEVIKRLEHAYWT